MRIHLGLAAGASHTHTTRLRKGWDYLAYWPKGLAVVLKEKAALLDSTMFYCIWDCPDAFLSQTHRVAITPR